MSSTADQCRIRPSAWYVAISVGLHLLIVLIVRLWLQQAGAVLQITVNTDVIHPVAISTRPNADRMLAFAYRPALLSNIALCLCSDTFRVVGIAKQHQFGHNLGCGSTQWSPFDSVRNHVVCSAFLFASLVLIACLRRYYVCSVHGFYGQINILNELSSAAGHGHMTPVGVFTFVLLWLFVNLLKEM